MSNDIRLEVTFVSRSIRPITKGFRATYRFVEGTYIIGRGVARGGGLGA